VSDEQRTTGAGEPRSAPASPEARRHGAPRHSRRRFIKGGALLAGIAALFALVRAAGVRGPGGGGGTGAFDLLTSFPVRSIEDEPETSPAEWVVEVDGLVERPLRIVRTDWARLPRFEQTVDFHCVEGWSVPDVGWGGVTPAVLLDEAGVRPEGTHVVFHAAGGEYIDSLPMDLVRHPQTVLADAMDGEPLERKHGGPLRLVVPAQLAYKSVKWVTRLEVTDRPVQGYWEERGYPMDAPIGSSGRPSGTQPRG
jgi:DMSO/TMAO reductase YedYZ molybdopterin-dependent catalytic subunit